MSDKRHRLREIAVLEKRYKLFIRFSLKEVTMPVAKSNPSAKVTKSAVVPARAPASAPRKTAKPATPQKTAAKRATPHVVAKGAAKGATKPAVKAPARKTAVAKAEKSTSAPAALSKPPKIKLVRDSFTIPRAEYEMLDVIKDRLVKLTRPAKKSEVLRAGIAVLAALNDAALLAALEAVPAIKTGRPKKAK